VRSLLPLLDPVIPLGAPLLPAGSLFAFDLPTIQDIVEWEGVRLVQKREAILKGEPWINPKTGRPSRASARGGDEEERYFAEVDSDGYQVASTSRLPPWH
jgi:hypothetical protein